MPVIMNMFCFVKSDSGSYPSAAPTSMSSVCENMTASGTTGITKHPDNQAVSDVIAASEVADITYYTNSTEFLKASDVSDVIDDIGVGDVIEFNSSGVFRSVLVSQTSEVTDLGCSTIIAELDHTCSLQPRGTISLSTSDHWRGIASPSKKDANLEHYRTDVRPSPRVSPKPFSVVLDTSCDSREDKLLRSDRRRSQEDEDTATSFKADLVQKKHKHSMTSSSRLEVRDAARTDRTKRPLSVTSTSSSSASSSGCSGSLTRSSGGNSGAESNMKLSSTLALRTPLPNPNFCLDGADGGAGGRVGERVGRGNEKGGRGGEGEGVRGTGSNLGIDLETQFSSPDVVLSTVSESRALSPSPSPTSPVEHSRWTTRLNSAPSVTNCGQTRLAEARYRVRGARGKMSLADGGDSDDASDRGREERGGKGVEQILSGRGSRCVRGVARIGGSLSECSYIDRVVMEILETEQTYVNDLSDIIQGYVNYFRSAVNSGQFKMSPVDVEALFGNIEAIYAFNKSVEVLTSCMKDEKMAAMLKQQQTILHHSLPLGSYLLKPVQRILKYHLLLHNILDHHDDAFPDHDVIVRAVDCMTNVARHINEMKHQHEHTVRTQEIQSLLYSWDGPDLVTLGDLLMEDKFRMCGARAARIIFLFKKAALIAKKKDDGTFAVKAFIMCSNLMLIESIPKQPLNFQLIPFDSPRVQYTMQASSLEQKRTWCQQLKRLILDNYSVVIPDKAKELVMTLGKGLQEEKLQTSSNVELAKRQQSAPEYLERWRGRRKSAGILHDLKLLKTTKRGTKKTDPLASTSPPATPEPIRRKSDGYGFLSLVQDSKMTSRKDTLQMNLENDKAAEFDSEKLVQDGDVEYKKQSIDRPEQQTIDADASKIFIASSADYSLISTHSDNSSVLNSIDESQYVELQPMLKSCSRNLATKKQITVVPSKTIHSSAIMEIGAPIALPRDVTRKDSIVVRKAKLTVAPQNINCCEDDSNVSIKNKLETTDLNRSLCELINSSDIYQSVSHQSSPKFTEKEKPNHQYCTVEDSRRGESAAPAYLPDSAEDVSCSNYNCRSSYSGVSPRGSKGRVGRSNSLTPIIVIDPPTSEELDRYHLSDRLTSSRSAENSPRLSRLRLSDVYHMTTDDDFVCTVNFPDEVAADDVATHLVELSHFDDNKNRCSQNDINDNKDIGNRNEEIETNGRDRFHGCLSPENQEEEAEEQLSVVFEDDKESDIAFNINEKQSKASDSEFSVENYRRRSLRLEIDDTEDTKSIFTNTEKERSVESIYCSIMAAHDESENQDVCLSTELKISEENPSQSSHIHTASNNIALQSSSGSSTSGIPPKRPCTPKSLNGEHLDGLAGTFRSAITHIASKLSHLNNSTTLPSTTCNTVLCDSQSLNSTDKDVYLNSNQFCPAPDTNPSVRGEKKSTTKSAHQKEPRYSFVYYLARAYSSRVKHGADVGSSIDSNNVGSGTRTQSSPTTTREHQLSNLLRENEPGSPMIGERIAQSAPATLGRTLTLAPRRSCASRVELLQTFSKLPSNGEDGPKRTPRVLPQCSCSAGYLSTPRSCRTPDLLESITQASSIQVESLIDMSPGVEDANDDVLVTQSQCACNADKTMTDASKALKSDIENKRLSRCKGKTTQIYISSSPCNAINENSPTAFEAAKHISVQDAMRSLDSHCNARTLCQISLDKTKIDSEHKEEPPKIAMYDQVTSTTSSRTVMPNWTMGSGKRRHVFKHTGSMPSLVVMGQVDIPKRRLSLRSLTRRHRELESTVKLTQFKHQCFDSRQLQSEQKFES